MSYDIVGKVKVEDTDIWVDIIPDIANITWNVRDIITKSTGLEWENEADNGLFKDVIPHIINGYNELLSNGEKYKEYESPNGWGTVAGTTRFFKQIIDKWDEFVNYSYNKELINYVHFWIE